MDRMMTDQPKASPPPTPVPAYQADWRERPSYNGKELRPFDGRPGAMDAYKLPSRGVG